MNITKLKNYFLGCFLAVIMLFLFCGCSGEQSAIRSAQNSKTNEEVIERNRAYLSEYPNGKYAMEAHRQIELAEIRLAGSGHGFSEAAAFDGTKGQPYKIFIIDVFKRHIGDRGQITKHKWNELLPSEWAAGTIREASLFIITSEGDLIHYESKRYNGREVKGYIVTTNIEVREARTGNLLFIGLLKGSRPAFPGSVSDTGFGIKGSPANYYQFENWLFYALP